MNEYQRLSLELALLLLQRPGKSFVKRARRILERVLDDEPQPLDVGEIIPLEQRV